MKKIIILILLLIPSYAFALGACISGLAGGVAGAASCNASTNEIGTRETGTNSILYKNYINCFKYTADCSGTLDTAYLYGTAPQNATATVGVYSNSTQDDTDPGTHGSSNTLIDATTANALDDQSGWASAVMGTGESVTSGTSYWVCFVVNAVDWLGSTANGVTRYTLSGTELPANLAGTWGSNANQQRSVYISIK